MRPVRICILGNSGSGKSTLTQELSERLNVPGYHLDKWFLVGNFEARPKDEQRRLHSELISQPSWIIDGNYRSLLPTRIARSTVVVFLDLGRALTIPRLVRRRLGGGQPLSTIPSGADPQLMTWDFLRWVATYNRRKRVVEIRRWCETFEVPLVVLGKDRIENWVETIRASVC